jgi:hypothetical protein
MQQKNTVSHRLHRLTQMNTKNSTKKIRVNLCNPWQNNSRSENKNEVFLCVFEP